MIHPCVRVRAQLAIAAIPPKRPTHSPRRACRRIDDDVAPNWDTFLRVLGNGEGLAKFAGPGQWNDFDMLETGELTTHPDAHPSTSRPACRALCTHACTAAGVRDRVD